MEDDGVINIPDGKFGKITSDFVRNHIKNHDKMPYQFQNLLKKFHVVKNERIS